MEVFLGFFSYLLMIHQFWKTKGDFRNPGMSYWFKMDSEWNHSLLNAFIWTTFDEHQIRTELQMTETKWTNFIKKLLNMGEPCTYKKERMRNPGFGLASIFLDPGNWDSSSHRKAKSVHDSTRQSAGAWLCPMKLVFRFHLGEVDWWKLVWASGLKLRKSALPLSRQYSMVLFVCFVCFLERRISHS
jgi:hypothetical protein